MDAPSQKQQASPVEFSPPKGFKPPDGDEQKDGKWDMVCTFETTGDGKIVLVKLGDTDMPKPAEKQPKRPNYDAMAESIASSAPQQPQ